MKMGISSAEVRLVRDYLLEKEIKTASPDYMDGYEEGVNLMSELLSDKVRENMETALINKMSFDEYENSAIENPSHYKGSNGLEAIEVHKNFLTPEELRGYYKGNTLKYLLRERNKNGLEDLKKARKHLEWLIEEREKEQEHDV